MHPRRSWIAIGLFAALAAHSAVVYKWTDANGVVHFSDQPVPGAERIVTAGTSINSYSAPSASNTNGQPPRAATTGSPSAPAAPITVTAPQPEQNFFNNEPINVSLSQQTLSPDESVSWRLNGAQLADQPSNATQFVLPTPGRGAFTIAATVTNQSTGEVRSTPGVTFYVKEPSLLAPQHRNP